MIGWIIIAAIVLAIAVEAWDFKREIRFWKNVGRITKK